MKNKKLMCLLLVTIAVVGCTPEKDPSTNISGITDISSWISNIINSTKTDSVHTVTFKDGDNVIDTREVEHNDILYNFPEVPDKEGYDGSWDYDSSPVKEDITVYPKYEPITYNISYVSEYGEANPVNKTSYTIEDERFNFYAPINGEAVGKYFLGWYTSEDYEEETKISHVDKGTFGNITLYAKWVNCAVESVEGFTIDYETETLPTISKVVDSTVDKIEFESLVTVSEECYWILSNDKDGNEIIESKTITIDKNGHNYYYLTVSYGSEYSLEYLVDIYKLGKYSYSFVVDEKVIKEDEIEGDLKIEKIEDPTKEGYTFKGWTIDGENIVTFPYETISNVTFKALFTPNKYQMELDYQNEKYNNETKEVYYDENITLPSPTKEGYTFVGWQDKDTHQIVNNEFVYKYDKSITLEAVYKENKYELIIKDDEGNTTSTSEVNFDTTFVTPDEITKEGHTFIGWKDQNGNEYEANKEYKWSYEGNITLTPVFKADEYEVTVDIDDSDSCTITGVGKHEYGEDVTLTVNLNYGYKFLGWYDENDKLISYEDSIIVTIGSSNVKYKIKTCKADYAGRYIIDGIKYEIVENNASVVGYTSDMSNEIVILSEIKGKKVTSIGDIAFSGCSSLKSLSFDTNSQLESIGKNAFKNCNSLTSITIPSSVISIVKGAFSGCSSLETITLPFIGGSKDNNQFLGYIFGSDEYYWNSSYVPSSLKEVIIIEGCTSINDYAFSYCNSLTSITIPSSVTSIGSNAFEGCGSITSIKIPDNVTSIGEDAFSYCNSLTSITIPSSVTSIGEYAFSDCSSLTSVVFADNSQLESIGSSAFYNCSSLTNMIIPDSVTSIGSSAFSGCSSLTSLEISGNVTSIGNAAFADCTSLRTITIPNSVTSIGYGAFIDCSSLETIVLPKYISTIENSMFNGCSSLKSVSIPSTVTSIGENAFSGCSSLTSIVVPTSVTSIARGAFYECSSLETMTLPFIGGSKDNASYLGYIFGANSYSSSPVPSSLKEVIILEGCTSIGNYAFQNCSSLISIVIPNSVTSIGYYAFQNCSSLTSIVIPNNMILIESTVFYNCSSLISVTIPSSVTSIEKDAFYGCNSLENVYYEGTLEDWCRLSFVYSNTNNDITNSNPMYYASHFYMKDESNEYKEITSIEIPETIISIGDYQFYGFSNVTSIVFSSSVTTIGEDAFNNCNSLTSITIPNSVTSIGKGAFRDCSSLKTITLPFIGGSKDNNQYLGYIFGAYSYFSSYVPSSLKEVIILEGCTSIGYGAFYNCSSLTSITVPSSVTLIGGDAFYGCSSLTSITIPSSVTSIGSAAFKYCSSLTNIIIPDSVTSIGESAFNNCSSLTNIIIPDSVTSIGESAFEYCSSLTSVIFADNSQLESIGSSAFSGCSSLKTITLPFIGESKDNNQFLGYIFGAGSYSNNSSSVPSSLKEVIILDGCTSIKYDAFYYCSSLTRIAIPSSVTSIGNNAFTGCTSLETVTLPFIGSSKDNNSTLHNIFGTTTQKSLKEVIILEGCTSIGSSAFYNCSSLTSITIPSSVTSIGYLAFEGCILLENVYYEGTIENWCKIHFDDWNSNPMYYDFNIYIKDENDDYLDFSKLTNIEIPDTIISIGDYQFYGFNNVTSIVIPSSVTSIGKSAFYGCSSLESITLPFVGGSKDNNQFLGYIFGASSYNYNDYYVPNGLKEVIILEGCTSIGDNAFYRCSSLTNITLPNDLSSIGNYAFCECSLLTNIIIPSSVTSIGKGAFSSCSSLKTITLPFIGESKDSNQFLGYIFGASSYNHNSSCVPSSLKEVIVLEDCTSIEYGAFYECSSLTDITLPNTITSIARGAFFGCGSLETITLPFVGESRDATELTSLFGHIFGGSSYTGGTEIWQDYSTGLSEKFYIPSSLKEVIILDKCISINQGAFSNCNFLTSITLPSSVTSIGDSAFKGCTSLETITLPFIGESKENNQHLSYIFGASSYNHNSSCVPSSLKEVRILEGCTSIEYGAFYNCDFLTSIVIPNSVTSIGYYAFYGCSSITSISIPSDINYIGKGAFEKCTSLETITLPFIGGSKDNNQFLGYIFGADSYKKNSSFVPESLKEVKLLENCTLINDYALYGCNFLTNIALPNDLSSIGNYAFCECSSLTNIIIPSSVTSIGKGAFEKCTSLETITLPFIGGSKDNNTHFGYIFGADSYKKNSSFVPESLKEVVILEGYTSIEYGAFYECSSLTSIIIPSSVTIIGEWAFYYCGSLTSIVLPNSLTSIGNYAFYNCRFLTSINIPNGVTSIGDCAFYECSSLTSIIIPSSVTSIEDGAFWYCDSLTIYCEAETQPSGWDNDWNSSNRPVVWGYNSQDN